MYRLFWLVITSCKEANHIKDSSFFRDLFQANDWCCLHLLNFFWCLQWWIKINNLPINVLFCTCRSPRKAIPGYLNIFQFKDPHVYVSIEQQSIPTSQPSKKVSQSKRCQRAFCCVECCLWLTSFLFINNYSWSCHLERQHTLYLNS